MSNAYDILCKELDKMEKMTADELDEYLNKTLSSVDYDPMWDDIFEIGEVLSREEG